MAKRKGAAAFLTGFLAKPGATKKEAAVRINRSVATVNRILAGKTSGETVREAAKELSRREPTREGKEPKPVPSAPSPAPRPPSPGTVVQHAGFTTTYLSPTRKAVTFNHVPTNKELQRALKGRTAKDIQLVVTFTDGKVARLLTHGWSKERIQRILDNAAE